MAMVPALIYGNGSGHCLLAWEYPFLSHFSARPGGDNTAKLVYKDHPRDQQNVALIHRWSLYAGSIAWKVYPCWPVQCGLYKQVVFIYRWSLQQVWLYSNHVEWHSCNICRSICICTVWWLRPWCLTVFSLNLKLVKYLHVVAIFLLEMACVIIARRCTDSGEDSMGFPMRGMTRVLEFDAQHLRKNVQINHRVPYGLKKKCGTATLKVVEIRRGFL